MASIKQFMINIRMGQFATKLDAEKEKKNQKEQKESKKVLLSKADKFKNHHANGKIDFM